jgi:hypothetical protein
MRSPAALALAALALASGGCPSSPSGAPMNGTVRSTTATANGLSISLEIRPDVRVDRVPMRAAILHFRNVSEDPIRIFLPQSEPFRGGQSTLYFGSGDQAFMAPEPRPHGYSISEIDFPLIAPGEEKTFEQPFTIDPMKPGPGTRTERRAGFEDGKTVKVRWSYSNDLVRWPAGKPTLDGPTKTVFDGKDIPHIWTGKLSVEASWTVR